MRVLITGVSGQDGYALAEQCLAAGNVVYGMARWDSWQKRDQLEAALPGLTVLYGDLEDIYSLQRVLESADPDIVYNLAALASSGQSWNQPITVTQINALGVVNLLEAIRLHNRNIRFVQASTSEQYGRVNEQPQSILTPFGSLNIYGVAKTFAHQATINYRDSYDMHASTALMHNHVSLRRNPYFVDRKITRAVGAIVRGQATELRLGNLDASRDWGWGPEYMQAWRLIAAHQDPDDYILCTGVSHSIEEFLQEAFQTVGLDWQNYVRQDEEFMRPTDVKELRGDPSYIYDTLGWKAEVGFRALVSHLVQADLNG